MDCFGAVWPCVPSNTKRFGDRVGEMDAVFEDIVRLFNFSRYRGQVSQISPISVSPVNADRYAIDACPEPMPPGLQKN
jgi:hypothetical protein